MPQKKLEIIVPESAPVKRLDQALTRSFPDHSRSFWQKLIKNNCVKVNGEICTSPRQTTAPQMTIQIELPPEAKTELAASEFDFPILYEDAEMVVIDKPPNVVVHPAPGNRTGTVVNALLGRYPGMGAEFAQSADRPGIVHRLDKDTSGVLVIAKTAEALFKLSRAFADRQTGKTYLALVRGVPPRPTGEIETLIGRHPVNRQKMAVVERNGKPALTRYRLQAAGMLGKIPVSLLEVAIFTGRTHQIRVHLAHIGLPVLGDTLYGGKAAQIGDAPRQMLHAWKLALPHPKSGEMLTFTAPIPADFAELQGQITFSADKPSR